MTPKSAFSSSFSSGLKTQNKSYFQWTSGEKADYNRLRREQVVKNQRYHGPHF